MCVEFLCSAIWVSSVEISLNSGGRGCFLFSFCRIGLMEINIVRRKNVCSPL